MAKSYSLDPKQIIARFNSKCAETGNPIKKGDSCIYYPMSKSVYCMESNQAEEYRGYMFDIQCLNANY